MKLGRRVFISLYLIVPACVVGGLLLVDCWKNLSPRNNAYFAERVMLVVDRDYVPIAARIMAGARESIYLSLFRIHDERHLPGGSTNQLIWELVHAVRRGVSVNVKLEQPAKSKDYWRENLFVGDFLKREGVNVFFDSKKGFLHAKLLVVDGNLSLVDSRNWCAWSLDQVHDLGVLVQSPCIAKQLISYWKSIPTEPPPAHEVEVLQKTEDVLGKKKKLWQDLSPISEWPWVKGFNCSIAGDRNYLPRVLALIEGAGSSIHVGQHVLNYRRNDDSMYKIMDALRRAAERGVKVNVIIEDYTPPGGSENSNQKSMKLLRSWGINVVPDSNKQSIHSKFLVIDDRYSIIGSTNWTPGSIEFSHELSLIIDSEELADQTKEYWKGILNE